jgi:hypothetical protein
MHLGGGLADEHDDRDSHRELDGQSQRQARPNLAAEAPGTARQAPLSSDFTLFPGSIHSRRATGSAVGVLPQGCQKDPQSDRGDTLAKRTAALIIGVA